MNSEGGLGLRPGKVLFYSALGGGGALMLFRWPGC